MLGSLGFFASKGMVAMPDLTGLTSTQAQNAIVAAGLTYVSATSVNTGNSVLENVVASQQHAPGTLLDYDTDATFVFYSYVASPPSGGGSYAYYCKTRYADGSVSEAYGSANDVSSTVCDSYRTVCQLGSTPATPTLPDSCNPCIEISRQTYPTSWSGTCFDSTQEIGTSTTEYSYSNCSPSVVSTTVYRTNTALCSPPPAGCTPTCGDWQYSSWSACSGGYQYRDRWQVCTAADCSTYTSGLSEQSQACTPPPPPPPTGCTPSSSSYRVGGNICTTYTYSDCTTSTSCSPL